MLNPLPFFLTLVGGFSINLHFRKFDSEKNFTHFSVFFVESGNRVEVIETQGNHYKTNKTPPGKPRGGNVGY